MANGTLQSNLGQRSAKLQNTSSPFKSSFKQLAGGGKAQSVASGQRQERLKKTGDVAKQKTVARGQEAKRNINQQSAQFNQQVQDKQDEMQTARKFAIEDFNNYVKDKMRERQQQLQLLQERKEKLRKQLQGYVDQDTLDREMEGINQLIEGGSSLLFAALPSIQQGRGERFATRSLKGIDASSPESFQNNPFARLKDRFALRSGTQRDQFGFIRPPAQEQLPNDFSQRLSSQLSRRLRPNQFNSPFASLINRSQ